MKKYAFDDTTIHTLHRLSKQLFETFSRADKTVIESDFTWTKNDDVDFSINPHLYYNFRFGHYQLFIHKHKNGTYSLQCLGFTPQNIKPYDVNKFDVELYKNLFGKYLDFSSVSEAFADVVNELTTYKVRSLF